MYPERWIVGQRPHFKLLRRFMQETRRCGKKKPHCFSFFFCQGYRIINKPVFKNMLLGVFCMGNITSTVNVKSSSLRVHLFSARPY